MPHDAPLPPLTRFDVRQASVAAYASLLYRSGPWTIQAGERFEDLRIDSLLLPGAVRGRRHLAGFNHSLSIERDIGAGQLILRLSRSRQKFDPRDLNPAVILVDAQNRYTGNPLLSPQEVTSAEAEYGFRRGPIEGAATVYYRRTDHTIADFTQILADNVLIASKRNGGRSQSAGAQLTVSGRTGKSLKYSLTGNVFRADLATLDGALGRPPLLSFTVQASLDWSLTARDQLHADANLKGRSLVPQGVRSGTGTANVVWRHALPRNWSLSLTVQGAWLDDRVLTFIRAPRAIDISARRDGGRAVLVGASWKMR